ncbi:MAG: adenylyl-sulfate kinase [Candidatus Neomarinimicrobiota bacterium]
MKNFTGIDDPYEEPENAELTVDTSKSTIDEEVNTIVEFLRSNRYIT